MCEPATIAMIAGGVAGLAGTATSVAGQVQAGDAAMDAAASDAEMLRHRRAAALQRGTEQRAGIQAEGRRIAGAGLATAAASGIETTTGSVANLFESNAMAVAADAETVRYNTALEAWGLESQADQTLVRGRAARTASILGAAGTAIGGAGQAVGMFATAAAGHGGPPKTDTGIWV